MRVLIFYYSLVVLLIKCSVFARHAEPSFTSFSDSINERNTNDDERIQSTRFTRVQAIDRIHTSRPITLGKELLGLGLGRLQSLRGGAVKGVISGKKKKSKLKAVTEVLDQVKPATRMYLLLCVFCSLVELVGLPAPTMFAIDRSKLYQIWRPFTSVAYLGPPSMSMANSLYFLVRYGQALETSNGTGSHAWFLLLQTVLLTALGVLFGFPMQAQAMIAATIYVSSRVEAMEKVPFQFGLIITSWQLPFMMMAFDCLSQQNIQAAWPHVLGIFSGHFYTFFTQIWPKLGGKSRFGPPRWFLKIVKDEGSQLQFKEKLDDKSKLKKMRRTKIGSGVGKARKLGK